MLMQPGLLPGVSFGSRSPVALTTKDAEAIQKSCPAVSDVASTIRLRIPVTRGRQSFIPLYVYGTTSQFLNVRGWLDLAEGRTFTENEVRGSKRICIIGQTVTKNLFEGESALGQEIRVGGVPMEVLGILDRTGPNEYGLDQDDIVLMPIGTSKRHLNKPTQASSEAPAQKNPALGRVTHVDQILLRVDSVSDLAEAKEQITDLLRTRHNLRTIEPDDFNIREMVPSPGLRHEFTPTSARPLRLQFSSFHR
jgi:hypothetical protein